MTGALDAEIRVRKRLGAVLFVYLTRLLAALLVAMPLSGAIAATGVGQFPAADAILFAPGGTYLVEALRLAAPMLGAFAQSHALLALVAGALGLIPLAALLVALCHAGRLRLTDWAARTTEHLPSFVFLSGLTLATQAAVIFLFSVLGASFRGTLQARFSERNADLAVVALLLVGIACVLGLGIVHDVARSACVRHCVGARRALAIALRVTRTHTRRALVGWLLPASAALVLVGAAAALVAALRVEVPSTLRLAGVVIVHQVVAFAIVLLRASWLCRALRLVGVPAEAGFSFSSPMPASGDRSEDSVAPGDPSPDRGA
jgi:hypothetical protein